MSNIILYLNNLVKGLDLYSVETVTHEKKGSFIYYNFHKNPTSKDSFIPYDLPFTFFHILLISFSAMIIITQEKIAAYEELVLEIDKSKVFSSMEVTIVLIEFIDYSDNMFDKANEHKYKLSFKLDINPDLDNGQNFIKNYLRFKDKFVSKFGDKYKLYQTKDFAFIKKISVKVKEQ